MAKDESIFEQLRELESLGSPESPNDQLVPSGQRACPICQQPMISSVKQGVAIDCCEEHGLWLDEGKLEAILDRIEKRSQLSRELAVQNTVRNERKKRGPFGGFEIDIG